MQFDRQQILITETSIVYFIITRNYIPYHAINNTRANLLNSRE